jgi:photosystem II stability/assembly factor-like uncharacterized protein
MKNFIFFVIIIFSLVYTNSDAQWELTSGANGSTIRGFAVNDAGIFAGFTARYDSAGVILSTDFGVNWSNVSTGLPAREIDGLFAHSSDLFASENDAGIYISTDNGASWTVTGLTVAYIYYFASIGTNLFAGDFNNGVLLSTDNGATWNFVNSGLTNTSTRALYAKGSNLFAGTRGGGVFLSSDNGTSWTAVNSGLTNHYIYALIHNGSNLFAGTYNSGVFLSTNNGTSWTAASNGLPSNTVVAFAVSGGNLFAGVDGSGVYLTTNNGSDWTDVTTGLTSLTIRALKVSGSYLYVGGENSGVWRRPLSEMITGAEDEQNSLPESYALYQNYPNPFNPSTKIKYSVTQSSNVLLKVFNVLGNEIVTIVNEEKPAGTYEVQFNGTGLPSGIYFYKLQAGNFVETKKMILLK